MNDPSNICLSCGLCCDGTLVGFVHVDRDEIAPLKALMEIDDENVDGFFLLPCTNLSCDGCSIYADRPKQCRSFNCGLLNSVTDNKVSFDSAISIISEVKEKKEDILREIETLELDLQSRSFYFKLLEVRKLFVKNQSEHSLEPVHIKILSEIESLDLLLSKRFQLSLS